MKKFTWPHYPENESEFEEMMVEIDSLLAEEGRTPFQRPAHVSRKLWEAFGWGGRIFPPQELASYPGFEGEVLMAKALRWYDETLGERLKTYFSIGYVPVLLGRNIWRLRLANWAGKAEFFCDSNLSKKGSNHVGKGKIPSINILTLVEKLPQGMANRLRHEELVNFLEYYMLAVRGMQWREGLSDNNLFAVASRDYDSSTSDLLDNRYNQSKWAAQQCFEKMIKGVLEISGVKYPKGSKGHDLYYLNDILKSVIGASVNKQLVNNAFCSTAVRYNEVKTNEMECFHANISILGLYDFLSNNEKVNELIRNSKK